ncbi:MAG: hypothetical protein R2684_08975 [Pyrinomonadaceae bacterium]
MKTIILMLVFLVAASCDDKKRDGNEGMFSSTSDRDEAVKLVEDANSELKRIRILYRENNSKVDELKKALAANDIAKVKRLADDLLVVIVDGYAFAETAREKLDDAQRLDINDDFKEYLRLKQESLRLQGKAFEYRKESAKLFRDRFGTDDKVTMSDAAKTFKDNEDNFEKSMAEAMKVSEEADKLYKTANEQGSY